MSEIKGIDQIFPKKGDEGSGNFKLWAAAGVVALLAAGYALVPTGGSPAPPQNPVSANTSVATTAALPEKKSIVETKKTNPAPVRAAVEDVKTERKQEAKRQQQQHKVEVSQAATPAPEVKAAAKALGGRSCDCETAELNLPAQCPDASCRQCKASCGIPGN